MQASGYYDKIKSGGNSPPGGDKLSRSNLAKRTKLKQADLDKILDALELDGQITRTFLKVGISGWLKQLITPKPR